MDFDEVQSDNLTLEDAVSNDDIEAVRLLLKYNNPTSYSLVYTAFRNNYYDVLKLLIDHNAPIDEWAIRYAAKNGYINT